MVKRGLLLPDNSGKPSQFTRVPGHAKPARPRDAEANRPGTERALGYAAFNAP
jgi:hypothetical protein